MVTPLGLGRVKWIDFSKPAVRIGVVLDGETEVLVFGPASVWPAQDAERAIGGLTYTSASNGLAQSVAAAHMPLGPIVTEEMCDVLGTLVYDNYGPGDRETMYRALEAALAVQPKPSLTEEERDFMGSRRDSSFEENELLAIIDRLTQE